MFKTKLFKIFVPLLVVSILLSIAAYAATAVETTYDSYINGTLSNDATMNIDGKTYVLPRAFEDKGMEVLWDEANREAQFNIFDHEKIVKNNVLFYKGNGQFIGNGVWIKTFNAETTTEYILTSRNVWSPSFVLNATEYDGDTINLYPNPVKVGERLVLLKAKTPSKYFTEVASKTPSIGDNVYFAGSIDTCRNLVSLSTVHSYEDFNLFDSNKEYMRTDHWVNNWGIGSPMYNTAGALVGIMVWDGPNHILSVKRLDIEEFLD